MRITFKNSLTHAVFLCAVTVLCAACDGPRVAMEEARRAVRANLKDPDSAAFSSEFMVESSGNAGWRDVAVCGTVNVRNSFGAYAGPIRYVATRSQSENGRVMSAFNITVEDPENMRATPESVDRVDKVSIFEKIYWNAHCVDQGHPATHTGTDWRRR